MRRHRLQTVLALALTSIAMAPAALAGGECINEEFCEEPCPALTCDSDADCVEGEVCVVSSTTCCATSSCGCDPDTGEWICGGACFFGIPICVPADSPECVPALSGTGAVLLAALAAAGLAASVLRRRS